MAQLTTCLWTVLAEIRRPVDWSIFMQTVVVEHTVAEAASAETWMNAQCVFAPLQSEYRKMIEENVEAKACIYLSPQSV